MNNGSNPRTITRNLLRYKGKVKFLQKANKLRRTNIFINEDFSRETMKMRKQLWNEVKAHCDKGRVAYLSYRTVVVKTGREFCKTNRHHLLNTALTESKWLLNQILNQ